MIPGVINAQTCYILIGSMGAGKSRIGSLLAEQLNCPFWDTDELVQDQQGMSVSQIFQHQGEAYFRLQEQAVVRSVFLTGGGVVATGGGVVLYEPNRDLLVKSGVVIYLHVSAEVAVERIEQDDQVRPLLSAAGEMLAQVQHYQQARSVLYESLADIIIDTDALSPTAVVTQICGDIQARVGIN